MPPLVEQLDLDLAWRRTKSDLQNGRVFVHSPLEIELVESDLKSWLDRLRRKIQDGYQPDSATLADIPKGNGAVRPGAMLSLEDRVLYSALVGTLLPMINKELLWSQGVIDFSYRLSGTPRRVEWFTNTFNAWTAFRKISLEKIDLGATHVVITDITGFYENIDLTVLLSDLRNLGSPEEITQLLSRCLNRWCVLPGRGVPQGLSASDILAKVYLNPIDRTMTDNGINFIRYVDDIRMFCNDSPKGKLALMALTQLLRRRGLNLQSAKTSVSVAKEVREKIEGVNPLINKVQEKYQKQLREFIRDTFPSIPIPEPQLSKGADAPPAIIREIFQNHFLKQKYLDKTLFHFLLRRLGDQTDNIAVDYCLKQLGTNPQETEAILQYLGTARANLPKIFSSLENFLISPENIYEFQIYQIFRWLNQLKTRPTDGLIAAARRYTFGNATPFYLRSVCRITLQEYGTFADLERLEDSYNNARNELERAQTIVSIKRMEAGRRNAFYGRVSGDGFLCKRACHLVQNGNL